MSLFIAILEVFLATLTAKVVCMTKENGEAGHVSVRQIEDKFYFVAGSKNVHCLFRTFADLDLYTDSRFGSEIFFLVNEWWMFRLIVRNGKCKMTF